MHLMLKGMISPQIIINFFYKIILKNIIQLFPKTEYYFKAKVINYEYNV